MKGGIITKLYSQYKANPQTELSSFLKTFDNISGQHKTKIAKSYENSISDEEFEK